MILDISKRIAGAFADMTVGTAIVLMHMTLADRARRRVTERRSAENIEARNLPT